MFRRILLPWLLMALTLLLDTTILPVFVSHWLLPLFALITVHTMGLLLGRTQGALFGMIAGLLVDITVSTPLGLMTLFYVGLGYLGGWFRWRAFQKPLFTLVSAGIAYLLFEMGMAVYLTLAAATVEGTLFLQALVRMALDIALTEVLYIAYDWLLKPSRSRFAPR